MTQDNENVVQQDEDTGGQGVRGWAKPEEQDDTEGQTLRIRGAQPEGQSVRIKM